MFAVRVVSQYLKRLNLNFAERAITEWPLRVYQTRRLYINCYYSIRLFTLVSCMV